jgi:hypothetical protein
MLPSVLHCTESIRVFGSRVHPKCSIARWGLIAWKYGLDTLFELRQICLLWSIVLAYIARTICFETCWQFLGTTKIIPSPSPKPFLYGAGGDKLLRSNIERTCCASCTTYRTVVQAPYSAHTKNCKARIFAKIHIYFLKKGGRKYINIENYDLGWQRRGIESPELRRRLTIHKHSFRPRPHCKPSSRRVG